MGTALVPVLLDRGCDVYVTSRKKREGGDHLAYLQGDAHDRRFLESILTEKADVIVDFMSYTSEEFKARADFLLNHAGQYIFLSSSRVYADAPRLTEKSDRLLDTVQDSEYLQTDEYALAKAKEENCLLESGRKNWTIVRPYVTYNDRRLQLTILEKDMWLDRVMRGKKMIYFDQFSSRETTMTSGRDVAALIGRLAGNPDTLGQVYHITTGEHHSWKWVFHQYVKEIEDRTGKKPRVLICRSDRTLDQLGRISRRTWQIRYDRLYDRIFDNKKIMEAAGTDFHFTSMKDGLHECMESYIGECQRDIHTADVTDYKLEGFLDRISGEREPLGRIGGMQDKIKYIIYRYLPVSFCEKMTVYLDRRREKKYEH